MPWLLTGARSQAAGLTRCRWGADSSAGAALASDPYTVGADPAGLAWSAMCCAGLAWIHNRRCAPLHPYIHYYNRRSVLTCTASGVSVVSGISGGAALDGMPSGVAQAVYRRLVWRLYCVRWNGSNYQKSPCKALCAVLRRW